MRGIIRQAVVSVLALSVIALPSVARADGPATQPSVIERVWQLLSDGQQRDAEQLLISRYRSNDATPQEVFLLGMMTRTRFEVDEAAPLFRSVVSSNPNTPDGQASAAVLALDANGDNDDQFDILRNLHKDHPDNAAYVWLLAVECRAFKHNEEGAKAFADLSKHFKTGPVLFHQTYANILDELQRYDESLPHRKLAIQLEPAVWSYEGMGDTYVRMGRWRDAEEPFQKALELSPTSLRTLDRLIRAQMKSGDHAGLVTSGQRLVELRPNDAASHSTLGVALMLNHSPQDAVAEFNKALAIDPGNGTYKSYAAQAQAAIRRAAATQAASNTPQGAGGAGGN